MERLLVAARPGHEWPGHPADKEHNFYSSTGPDRESYRDTLRRTHLFLKDLGWLTSDPAVPE